jgi:hypothetical protein
VIEIYCAFNPDVNKQSWESGQHHIVKIGHTDPSSKTSRIDVLRDGWPPTGKKKSMSLAAHSNWDYVGQWPVKYGRSDATKLERRIRRWFFDRCGAVILIEKMRPEVLRNHRELNGLTELVCVDLSKIGDDPKVAPVGAWTYPETPDLIRKIIAVVRMIDAELRCVSSNRNG